MPHGSSASIVDINYNRKNIIMIIHPGILAKALQDLDKSMRHSLDGTKIEQIKDTIGNYAIAAAIASGVAGIAPGFAGVAAALTQAGFVWATYVKINKTLDISMSENTAKFIGSAVVTNLVTNAGAFIAVLIGSSIVSIIPGGQVLSVAMNATLGYTIVYVSAIIYLKLITRMMQSNGTLKVSESDDTKHIIRDIIKESNIKDMVKEGKASYKQAKKDGSIDRAKNAKKCPKCGSEVKDGQRFCSECRKEL